MSTADPISAPREAPPTNAVRGAALMLVGCGALTINDALMKALVADLPVAQVVAMRGAVGLGLCVVAAAVAGGMRRLRPSNVRNVGLLTMLLLYNLFVFPLSLRYMPLADAIILAYLSPAVVAALSPWLLSEKVGWRRWSAVALGVVGAAMVVEPGGKATLAAILPISVAVMVGLRDLMTRRIIHGEDALALTAAGNLGATVVGLASVPEGWAPLDALQWGQLVLTAALLTLAQFLMAASFRYAEASALSCLKYSSILWAAGLGWWFFDETLSAMNWAGAAMIAVSGVVITLRSRAQKADAA